MDLCAVQLKDGSIKIFHCIEDAEKWCHGKEYDYIFTACFNIDYLSLDEHGQWVQDEDEEIIYCNMVIQKSGVK